MIGNSTNQRTEPHKLNVGKVRSMIMNNAQGREQGRNVQYCSTASPSRMFAGIYCTGKFKTSMHNLLPIPYKKTCTIDLVSTIRTYRDF